MVITLLINSTYIIQEVALVVLFFSSYVHQHVECGSFNRCNGRWCANEMTVITILYTVSTINLIIYLFYTLNNGYLWLWYLQWLQHIQHSPQFITNYGSNQWINIFKLCLFCYYLVDGHLLISIHSTLLLWYPFSRWIHLLHINISGVKISPIFLAG